MHPQITRESLEQFLRTHVPLAPAMGVRVAAAGPDSIRLHVPLAPNLNHHGTAFGGSLSAVGILAGWALLHVRLLSEGVDAGTVVADSRTRYLSPIETDFEAEAIAPTREQWSAFLDTLARWGRARLVVQTQIRAAGSTSVPGVIHEGIFVAMRDGVPATSR